MNNNITLKQWSQISIAVLDNAARNKLLPHNIYSGVEPFKGGKERYYIYDNYDYIHVPGLDFILKPGEESGMLTVYNGSEQARAPATFEQGLKIAENFFNYEGYDLSEEIVCNWVMDDRKSVF